MAGRRNIDSLLKSATGPAGVPGVVAMAGNPKDVFYQGAFGKRALPMEPAMTADTVFWIASMTKVITSAAATRGNPMEV